jgi:hypothetical protein
MAVDEHIIFVPKTFNTPIEQAGKRRLNAHIFEREINDWYVEPKWCTSRLIDAIDIGLDGITVDPSCGGGNVVLAIKNHPMHQDRLVIGTDIINRNRSICSFESDFLSDDWEYQFRTSQYGKHQISNIISNPPFKLCGWKSGYAFIRRALSLAVGKVALLLPATFDCSIRNSKFLIETPFTQKIIITPRPSMPSGFAIRDGCKVGNGTKDFAWYIWDLDPIYRHFVAPTISWIKK